MPTLIPIRSKIIVQKMDTQQKSKTGLDIVKDQSQPGTTMSKGKVLYVGTGLLRDDGVIIPMIVKPEDIVYYSQFASQTIEADGENYIVIDERDVLAVVRN